MGEPVRIDDRHWWFSAKLQEYFSVGGYDKPSLLEDFMCENTTLELIGSFLGEDGTPRLFFYCQPSDDGKRRLYVTDMPPTSDGYGDTCVYFLRSDVSSSIALAGLERQVLCGVLRHSAVRSLCTLLSDVYAPLLHAQTDWGQCGRDDIQAFLTSLDKLLAALSDQAALSTSSHAAVLRMPASNVATNPRAGAFGDKQLRQATEQLKEYEQLCLEWSNVIEGVLLEGRETR